MNAVTRAPAHPGYQAMLRALRVWAFQARYFTFSALVHLVLVIVFGGVVLFQQFVEPPDFTAESSGLVSHETVAPPPLEQPLLQPMDYTPAAPSVAAAASSAPSLPPIMTNAAGSTFTMVPMTAPRMTPNTATATAPTTPVLPGVKGQLTREMASAIASFTASWAKGGTSSMGKPLRSREFVFTAYLAKYSGGDWDSTIFLKDEKTKDIIGGSLPNLLYVISKFSHKKIQAEPQAVPLDLSSDEIFVKKPPFIWFTGHRDFTLTDKEMANLAQYLRHGGCIWGDSSLPGQRSRFDIAFRREMRRLLPEINPQWQALPPNHPIFTNTYYSEIKAVPPGINFYDEPVYALIGFGGEIAVLYTANDYGDMWQFGLDENGELDLRRDEKRRMVAVNEAMWHRRNLYFRNIEVKALSDTYKFGTNIIVHLLTRWEDKIRTAPRM